MKFHVNYKVPELFHSRKVRLYISHGTTMMLTRTDAPTRQAPRPELNSQGPAKTRTMTKISSSFIVTKKE